MVVILQKFFKSYLMKLLNLLITSIVCGSALLLPEPIMAGNGNGNGSTPTGQSGKPIIVPNKPLKKYPGAPSRVFIEGWYTNSYIELTFPAEVEYMTVSLSAGEIVVWEDVLTVDEPSAHFPEMHGEFTLTVTTDDGRVFECVIDL